jgi:hypothetical protein
MTHLLRTTACADFLDKGKVLGVGQGMDVTEPRPSAPCRAAEANIFANGVAVLASGLGHSLAPPR